ncbi:MAG TPA: hypothetical protein VF853_00300 [Candidatus Deferrimicrobiaceae bacterium]
MTATTGKGKDRAHDVRLRDLVHVLVILAGWVLFFYWWWVVLPSTSRGETAWALLIILGVSLVTAIGTVGWVRYNLGIYRRKGPRRTVPDVLENAEADVLGRKLSHPGMERLRSARLVTVSLNGENGKSLTPVEG